MESLKNKIIYSIQSSNAGRYTTRNTSSDRLLLNILGNASLSVDRTNYPHLSAPGKYNAILKVEIKEDMDYGEYTKEHIEMFLAVYAKYAFKDNNYIITGADIVVKKEDFDFSKLTTTEEIKKTWNKIEVDVKAGHIAIHAHTLHTILHSFLRFKAREFKITFTGDEKASSLFTKIYKHIAKDKDEGILNALRSAANTIDILDTIRNKQTLSHPNERIIGDKEAKLMFGLAKSLLEYIDF